MKRNTATRKAYKCSFSDCHQRFFYYSSLVIHEQAHQRRRSQLRKIASLPRETAIGESGSLISMLAAETDSKKS